MTEYKQARNGPSNGAAAIDESLKLATGVPLGVAEKGHEVAEITTNLFAITNPNMKSDLTTAHALAQAAITGALANVEINLASLKDQGFAADVKKRAQSARL